jgi:hypothetical protein
MDVTEFDIQTQNYTMSAIHSEGAQSGDDAIRVLSNDGLEVVIDLLFYLEYRQKLLKNSKRNWRKLQ